MKKENCGLGGPGNGFPVSVASSENFIDHLDSSPLPSSGGDGPTMQGKAPEFLDCGDLLADTWKLSVATVGLLTIANKYILTNKPGQSSFIKDIIRALKRAPQQELNRILVLVATGARAMPGSEPFKWLLKFFANEDQLAKWTELYRVQAELSIEASKNMKQVFDVVGSEADGKTAAAFKKYGPKAMGIVKDVGIKFPRNSIGLLMWVAGILGLAHAVRGESGSTLKPGFLPSPGDVGELVGNIRSFNEIGAVNILGAYYQEERAKYFGENQKLGSAVCFAMFTAALSAVLIFISKGRHKASNASIQATRTSVRELIDEKSFTALETIISAVKDAVTPRLKIFAERLKGSSELANVSNDIIDDMVNLIEWVVMNGNRVSADAAAAAEKAGLKAAKNAAEQAANYKKATEWITTNAPRELVEYLDNNAALTELFDELAKARFAAENLAAKEIAENYVIVQKKLEGKLPRPVGDDLVDWKQLSDEVGRLSPDSSATRALAAKDVGSHIDDLVQLNLEVIKNPSEALLAIAARASSKNSQVKALFDHIIDGTVRYPNANIEAVTAVINRLINSQVFARHREGFIRELIERFSKSDKLGNAAKEMTSEKIVALQGDMIEKFKKLIGLYRPSDAAAAPRVLTNWAKFDEAAEVWVKKISSEIGERDLNNIVIDPLVKSIASVTLLTTVLGTYIGVYKSSNDEAHQIESTDQFPERIRIWPFKNARLDTFGMMEDTYVKLYEWILRDGNSRVLLSATAGAMIKDKNLIDSIIKIGKEFKKDFDGKFTEYVKRKKGEIDAVKFSGPRWLEAAKELEVKWKYRVTRILDLIANSAQIPLSRSYYDSRNKLQESIILEVEPGDAGIDGRSGGVDDPVSSDDGNADDDAVQADTSLVLKPKAPPEQEYTKPKDKTSKEEVLALASMIIYGSDYRVRILRYFSQIIKDSILSRLKNARGIDFQDKKQNDPKTKAGFDLFNEVWIKDNILTARASDVASIRQMKKEVKKFSKALEISSIDDGETIKVDSKSANKVNADGNWEYEDFSVTRFGPKSSHSKRLLRKILQNARLRQNIDVLKEELKKIQVLLNAGRLTIGSGYRDEQYNTDIAKGAVKSRHMHAAAADFKHEATIPQRILDYDRISRAMDQGEIKQGGLGLYNNFIHYDFRGTRARWYQKDSPDGKIKDFFNNWKYRYKKEEGVQEMKKLDLERLVKEVINENTGQGYAPYPYDSSVNEDEQPLEDFAEEWKALELEVIQDKTRSTAIELAKILVKDLELFNDVLDLTGKNQSVGQEILNYLKQAREQS